MSADIIVDFYENTEIFITGGSGVVGKAAIEKLLRSCNVKKIYILLRSKKGVSCEKRLEEIKKSSIFDILKEQKPNELDKLIAIPGDIIEDGLGISTEHLDLMKNVSVVFNSAASTRFTEPLKSAIRLNIKSTYEALKIAKVMKNLKIFVHISTYFSNPNVPFIEDKVYPTVVDWKTALKMLDLPEDQTTLDVITKKFIAGFPNTYIFTKNLAEKLVDDHRTEIPVAIYRPSVVVSACQEPMIGFTETVSGIMGLLTVWGTGLMQSFLIKSKTSTLDMVPLDMGTKTLIMFTALRGQLSREKIAEATPVGKFSSLATVPSTVHRYLGYLDEAIDKNPLEKSFWIPNVTVTTCPFVHWVLVWVCQLIPAFLFDIVLRMFRIKPFMMALQRKIYITTQALFFFIENESKSDGITDFEEMCAMAKGTDFDITYIQEVADSEDAVRSLIQLSLKGCRKYLLNEPDSSIDRCRTILKMKKLAYNILRGIVLFYIVRGIYRSYISNMIEQITI